MQRVQITGQFDLDDIGWICDTYFEHGSAPGTTWHRSLRDAHLRLPSWFVPGLDPLGDAYARQQERLWQRIAGVEHAYRAEEDEKEHSWGDIDPVRTPGFYVRRDAQAVTSAADHVLAIGMLLKHSGLAPGDRALEYGPGFGQGALTLARLGVEVDTVDISKTFCSYVQRQAEHFAVPLASFHGPFGMNPRPGQRYKLVWFYESFHHCVDFQRVVPQLRSLLADGGRVILSGEPIVERQNAAVPYPWGIRLHSEVVAVVRRQHWFELGFSEDFLFTLFSNAGFRAERIDCPPSLFGRLYVFEPRGTEVDPASGWLPPQLGEAWRVEGGLLRQTRADTTLPLDTEGFAAIEVDVVNPSSRWLSVTVGYGSQKGTARLRPRQQQTMRFDAEAGILALAVTSRRGRLPFSLGDRRGAALSRIRYLP